MQKGDKQVVVVDGVPGRTYDRTSNLEFTPDSKHVVYGAERADKFLVVMDSIESKEHDSLLMTDSCGSDCFRMLAMRASEYLQVEIKIIERVRGLAPYVRKLHAGIPSGFERKKT